MSEVVGAQSADRRCAGRNRSLWQALPAVSVRLAAALAVSLLLIQPGMSVASAQTHEPVWLEGTWVGTWWMGKYEEPIEIMLSQRGAALSGQVAMLGYPAAGDREGPFPIESGSLDGNRLMLSWLIEGRRFTAEFLMATPGVLIGLGGEDGRVAAGFGLNRVR